MFRSDAPLKTGVCSARLMATNLALSSIIETLAGLAWSPCAPIIVHVVGHIPFKLAIHWHNRGHFYLTLLILYEVTLCSAAQNINIASCSQQEGVEDSRKLYRVCRTVLYTYQTTQETSPSVRSYVFSHMMFDRPPTYRS